VSSLLHTYSVTLPPFWLNRIIAFVARPDPLCVFHRQDKELPIANLTSSGSFSEGIQYPGDILIEHDDFNLELR
jgi:hypothetical protein